MDTTIRNLDEGTYRALKARAALSGRTMGEIMNEAMQLFLGQPDPFAQTGSLNDLRPRPYPVGTKRLSEQVDREVYGV